MPGVSGTIFAEERILQIRLGNWPYGIFQEIEQWGGVLERKRAINMAGPRAFLRMCACGTAGTLTVAGEAVAERGNAGAIAKRLYFGADYVHKVIDRFSRAGLDSLRMRYGNEGHLK